MEILICNHHKICDKKECPHIIYHEYTNDCDCICIKHDSICKIDNQELRKQKINIINEKG